VLIYKAIIISTSTLEYSGVDYNILSSSKSSLLFLRDCARNCATYYSSWEEMIIYRWSIAIVGRFIDRGQLYFSS
jgi:hypothetical protein